MNRDRGGVSVNFLMSETRLWREDCDVIAQIAQLGLGMLFALDSLRDCNRQECRIGV